MTDRHRLLMRINDASKELSTQLTSGRLTEEICISREQDTIKRGCSIEQIWIRELPCPSSWAVNTSTRRNRNPIVIALGTCTSMYRVTLTTASRVLGAVFVQGSLLLALPSVQLFVPGALFLRRSRLDGRNSTTAPSGSETARDADIENGFLLD